MLKHILWVYSSCSFADYAVYNIVVARLIYQLYKYVNYKLFILGVFTAPVVLPTMQRGDTSLVVLVVLSVAVLARTTPSPAPPAPPHSDVTIPRHQATAEQDMTRDSPPARDADAEDLQHLESSLLNMFGLSKRPRPNGPIRVPQHMIELYKIQAGITGDLDIETNRRTVKRHPGNTIRSFYSEGMWNHDYIWHTCISIRMKVGSTRGAQNLPTCIFQYSKWNFQTYIHYALSMHAPVAKHNENVWNKWRNLFLFFLIYLKTFLSFRLCWESWILMICKCWHSQIPNVS